MCIRIPFRAQSWPFSNFPCYWHPEHNCRHYSCLLITSHSGARTAHITQLYMAFAYWSNNSAIQIHPFAFSFFPYLCTMLYMTTHLNVNVAAESERKKIDDLYVRVFSTLHAVSDAFRNEHFTSFSVFWFCRFQSLNAPVCADRTHRDRVVRTVEFTNTHAHCDSNEKCNFRHKFATTKKRIFLNAWKFIAPKKWWSITLGYAIYIYQNDWTYQLQKINGKLFGNGENWVAQFTEFHHKMPLVNEIFNAHTVCQTILQMWIHFLNTHRNVMSKIGCCGFFFYIPQNQKSGADTTHSTAHAKP